MGEQELKDILEAHKEWLKDKGFKNPSLSKEAGFKYWVSENGKIASAITPALSVRKIPKIIKQRIGTNGYLSISVNGKNKSVHRLIACEYLGPIKNKIVHHKNGNKKDNDVKNLKVTNYAENNKGSAAARKKAYGGFISICQKNFDRNNK